MTTAELFQEFPRPDPSASTRRRGRCAAARRRCGTGWRARRGSAAPRIATELAAARLAMAFRPSGMCTTMAMRGVSNYGADQNEEPRAFANTQVIV
jgi:hypothetical protein